MPVISMFYGIIVLMYYFDNKKHHLPHIHVQYAEQEVVLSIPNGEVLEFTECRAAGRQNLGAVAPIHEYICNGAVLAIRDDVPKGQPQELNEFVFAHFTGRHGKLPMFKNATTAHMPVDRHVVGWISEDHVCSFMRQEPLNGCTLER